MEPAAEQIREILDEIQTMAHDRQAMSPEDLGILYQELLEDPQPAGVLGRARHRKTSGAFYTDQTLAQATVRHALQPLMRGRGKDPQAILDLRICDPAMGCGAFLLATLRILSQALAKSLVRNGWLADRRVERPAGGTNCSVRVLHQASQCSWPHGHRCTRWSLGFVCTVWTLTRRRWSWPELHCV